MNMVRSMTKITQTHATMNPTTVSLFGFLISRSNTVVLLFQYDVDAGFPELVLLADRCVQNRVELVQPVLVRLRGQEADDDHRGASADDVKQILIRELPAPLRAGQIPQPA